MKYLILVFCLFAFTSQAQQGADLMFDVKEIGLYKGTPTYYLLGDSVLLREEATTKSAIVTMLPIGEKLTLHARSAHIDTIKGIKCHWYQVKTAEYKGWVWGGFIAREAYGSRSNPDIKFVIGLDRITEGSGIVHHQIRAISNKKLLTKITLEWPTSYIDFKYSGSKGLKEVDDIITVSNICESCGCTSWSKIIFWNGFTFDQVITSQSTGDAWASSGQYLIYPTDMEGIAGQVIKISDSFMEEAQGETLIKRELRREYFMWKNKKLQLQQEKTTTKIYYQEW